MLRLRAPISSLGILLDIPYIRRLYLGSTSQTSRIHIPQKKDDLS